MTELNEKFLKTQYVLHRQLAQAHELAAQEFGRILGVEPDTSVPAKKTTKKAAKAAPPVAPAPPAAPPQAPAAPTGQINASEFQTMYCSVMSAGKFPALQKLFKEHGFNSMSEVPTTKYPEMYGLMQAL